MRNWMLSLMAIVLWISYCFGSQDWIYQHPLPQGNTLNDIYLFDSMKVIVIGGSGTILMSSDGGESWEVQHGVANLSKTLYKVFFVNEITGYVVGEAGTLLKTENAGANWRLIQTITNYDLIGIYFINENIGWVVGDYGTIIKTVDGGRSWKSQSKSTFGYYSTVFFVNEYTGWIAGYNNSILKTIDGGATWIPQQVPTSYVTFNCIYFLNENIGYVCGANGTILKTEDGGSKWIQQLSRTYDPINKIHFKDEKHGWAVGGCPCCGTSLILRTVDGGYNWLHSPLANLNVIHGVAFYNLEIGYFVGTGGTIFQTMNGGKDWKSMIDCKSQAHLLGAYFSDAKTGWAVGENGTIFHTDDSGETWTVQSRVNGISDFFADIIFCNESTAFIVTWFGIILKTTDSGQNWQLRTNGVPRGCSLSAVSFPTETTGYSVGDVILKTIDGGESWQSLDIGYEYTYLRDVKFVTTDVGYIVGDDALIFKTINGGNTWEKLFQRNLMELNACYFIDENIGWAVGWVRYESVILRTLDGGQSWEYQDSGADNSLFDVFFTDDRTGWAVGSGGSILHTDNAGHNWEVQTGTSEILRAIYFVDDKNGWTVGSGGSILKKNIVKNKSEDDVTMPENIELLQNYPNPFNILTIISFRLLRSYNIELKIYDILGREVTTLIYHEIMTGYNEITFSAKMFTTGTYFYRLKATGVGEYSDENVTKVGKLLLLK